MEQNKKCELNSLRLLMADSYGFLASCKSMVSYIVI